MDIMKLAGGICGRVLLKDYAVYKKWINEWYVKHFIALKREIKLRNTKHRSISRALLYFSMVKIPLGSAGIFKAKYVACKITTSCFKCFFDLKQYTTFFHALPLSWRVLLVLDRVSINNANFVAKNSSHVTLECFVCKNISLALGKYPCKYPWPVIQPQRAGGACH